MALLLWDMPVSELTEEKPQRCRTMTDGADAELPLLQQVYLIGAYLFRPKLIRRTTKMFCERLHHLQIAVHSSLRVITTLELFQHHFAKLGHRDLLVTHTLRHRRGKVSTCDTRSVRRAGGFVLTPQRLPTSDHLTEGGLLVE